MMREKLVDIPLQQRSALCKQAVSANMADNKNDDLRRQMEAQEQTSNALQDALDNIQ